MHYSVLGFTALSARRARDLKNEIEHANYDEQPDEEDDEDNPTQDLDHALILRG